MQRVIRMIEFVIMILTMIARRQDDNCKNEKVERDKKNKNKA